MPFRAVSEPLRVSQEDFLARVRRDKHTHYSFLDGIVSPMPKDSTVHRRICTNIHTTLQAQLKGAIPNCQVFLQAIIAVAPHRPSSSAGMFTSCDVLITEGAPQYHDPACTAIRDALVIIEVCSPETEEFDAGEKFRRYRHGLQRLQEVVLIAERRCEVAHYRALGTAEWPLTLYSDLDDTLSLHRMPVRMALRALYAGVLVGSPEDAEAPKEEIPPWQWYDR